MRSCLLLIILIAAEQGVPGCQPDVVPGEAVVQEKIVSEAEDTAARSVEELVSAAVTSAERETGASG